MTISQQWEQLVDWLASFDSDYVTGADPDICKPGIQRLSRSKPGRCTMNYPDDMHMHDHVPGSPYYTEEDDDMEEDDTNITGGTEVARRYRVPGCNYCNAHVRDDMMPPHDCSAHCESGGNAHCTCDTCY